MTEATSSIANGDISPAPKGDVEHSHDTPEEKPNWYCCLIARKPVLMFILTLLGNLSFIITTMILVVVGYDILPVNFGRIPLSLETDVMFLRGEAWQQRDNNSNIYPKIKTNSIVTERSYISERVQLIFEGGNVFTRDNLKRIDEIERDVTGTPGYSDYCLARINNTCDPPQSILRLFDGTYASLNPIFNDPHFDNIPAVLSAAMNSNVLKQSIEIYIGKDAQINGQVAQSSVTRIYLNLAMPLSGYNNLEDRKDEQRDKITKFVVDNLEQKLADYATHGVGGMEFMYYSVSSLFDAISSQVYLDLALAGGSLVFIFIFMLFQTQSLMITGLGVFSIITSFAGANLIYRIIFDYRYFGIFHILAVFIILGIGADDIFVFFDTWRATSHQSYPSLAHRLSECYRRAAITMLVTSLTTMVAFFANAFSPFLVIGSFGLFSGILVLVNYISVIVFFPTVVVLHHLKWEAWTWCCCRPCVKTKAIPAKVAMTTDNNIVQTPESPVPYLDKSKRRNFVVRFFAGPYYKIITHRIIRWFIILFFLTAIVLASYQASKLGPDEEAIEFFREYHNIAKAAKHIATSFKQASAGRLAEVHLIWGIDTLDKSHCHKTDISCTGKTVWNDQFNLNPETSQTALLKLCEELKHLSSEDEKRLHIQRNVVTGLLEVNCFLENMNNYLQQEANSTTYAPGTNLSLPITKIRMNTLMAAHSELYSMTWISPSFNRYFEVGTFHWLTNGYAVRPSHDFNQFSDLLGDASDGQNTLPITNRTGYYFGTRLRYAAITVNTTLQFGNLGYVEGLPIVDAWEEFFNDKMKSLPSSLNGGFQVTPAPQNLWHWLKVQKLLASSAVQGIVIGICLAFPILVLATQNIIVGSLATLTIGCIVVSVIGVIPTAGWKLGVLESLNLSLVVGLAVDYVVHLAEGYHLSKKSDRLGRVHDMLQEVGVSVLSGAITTMGASFFMLFALILFFFQFGIFMFCTICFSLLYALVMFSTVLALIGPQNNFGSIRPLFTAIKKCFTKKRDVQITHMDKVGQGRENVVATNNGMTMVNP